MSDLPQPNEAFDWVQAPAGPALICRPLARHARHLYTTRHWTLGRDAARWDEVAAVLDLEASALVRVRQVHGASVLIVQPGAVAAAGTVEADIIVAGGAADALGMAVQAADCVPLLIADRRRHAAAAAHAGWRGLAAGVPAVAVAAMTAAFGSAPSDLVAAIGPSIGACCYEVGVDVKERFEWAGCARERIARWFHDRPVRSRRNPPMHGLPLARRDDHWFFDGWSAARDQLVDSAVPPDQIFLAELCTASHPATFCSYRLEGSQAGRMAGAIVVGQNHKVRT